MTADVKEKVEVDVSLENMKPEMHKVIFHNDNKTTMDFVIAVLVRYFDKDAMDAYDIMMRVHNDGAAVVGVYPAEIAEMKVHKTVTAAQNHGQPLRVTHEPE